MNNRKLITKIDQFYSLATSDNLNKLKVAIAPSVFNPDAAAASLKPKLRAIQVTCKNCFAIVSGKKEGSLVSRAMVASAEAVVEKGIMFDNTKPALVFAFLNEDNYRYPAEYKDPVDFASDIVAGSGVVENLKDYVIKEVPRTEIKGDLGDAKNSAYNVYVVVYKK
jgi:hypothetical protein